MSKQCSVCKLHINKRILIEEKLCNGATYAEIAQEQNLSPYALSNHFKNHLTADQLGDAKSVALLASDNWTDNVEAMIGLAKSAIKEARRKGHLGMVLQGMERLEKLYAIKMDSSSANMGQADLQKVLNRLPSESQKLIAILIQPISAKLGSAFSISDEDANFEYRCRIINGKPIVTKVLIAELDAMQVPDTDTETDEPEEEEETCIMEPEPEPAKRFRRTDAPEPEKEPDAKPRPRKRTRKGMDEKEFTKRKSLAIMRGNWLPG